VLSDEAQAYIHHNLHVRRFSPGQVVLGGAQEDQLCFVIHGRVSCNVVGGDDGADGGAAPVAVASGTPAKALGSSKLFGLLGQAAPSAAAAQPDSRSVGDPFDRVRTHGAQTLSLAPGAVLGEWDTLDLHAPPGGQLQVVAETQLATLVLPEAPLRTALQMDDALHINLGYANALRRTFCLLHRLEPFCRWRSSKLWRWLENWHQVTTTKAGESLGFEWKLLVLVRGECLIDGEVAAPPELQKASSTQSSKPDSGLNGGPGPSPDKRGRKGSTLGAAAGMLGLYKQTSMAAGVAAVRRVTGPELLVYSEGRNYAFSREAVLVTPNGDCDTSWLSAENVAAAPSSAPALERKPPPVADDRLEA